MTSSHDAAHEEDGNVIEVYRSARGVVQGFNAPESQGEREEYDNMYSFDVGMLRHPPRDRSSRGSNYDEDTLRIIVSRTEVALA